MTSCAGLLNHMSVPVSLLMFKSTLGDKTPPAHWTVQPTAIMSYVVLTVVTPVPAAIMPPVGRLALRDVSAIKATIGVEPGVSQWKAVAASIMDSTIVLASPSGQTVAHRDVNATLHMTCDVLLHLVLLHKSAPSEMDSWAVTMPCPPALYGEIHTTSPLMEQWLISRELAPTSSLRARAMALMKPSFK